MIIDKTHPEFNAIRIAALIAHKTPKSEHRAYRHHIYSDGAHIYATCGKRAIRVAYVMAPGYWGVMTANKTRVGLDHADPTPTDVPDYPALFERGSGWADIADDVDLGLNLSSEELYWRITILTGTPWNFEHIKEAAGATGTDGDARIYWCTGKAERLIFETDTVAHTTMRMNTHGKKGACKGLSRGTVK